MKFLFNDQIDWNTVWFPTHIIGIDGEALPVSIGIAKTFLQGFIGIYIKERYIKYIKANKPYVLIHDPQPNMRDINVNWDELPNKESNDHHLHIYKEI